MELVIIIATITSFFSHFLIEKGFVANAVSVIFASLITWSLLGTQSESMDGTLLRNISITIVLAIVVSILVGLVFSYHKKCSK